MGQGSPIQMMLAQAAAKPAASAVQPDMEQLCKEAGTNQRKREALGCPPLAGETVNKPTVTSPSTTPGDPDVGAAEGGTEAEVTNTAPSALDIALRKQEMKLPLTAEEQAALDLYLKQQAAEQATAEAQPAEPSLWERAVGWMKGIGK